MEPGASGGDQCGAAARRLGPPVPLEKEEDVADRREKATPPVGRELSAISAPAVFLADPVVETGLAKGNAGGGEVDEKPLASRSWTMWKQWSRACRARSM